MRHSGAYTLLYFHSGYAKTSKLVICLGANMLGIGMPELIVIAVIALIVIGPEKLPGLARTLGRIFGELKKATNEFKETMEVESKMVEVKKAFDGINETEIADKAVAAEKTDEAEKTEGEKTEEEVKLENLEALSEPPAESAEEISSDNGGKKNEVEKEDPKRIA